jgi:uncharacterized protein YukE
VAIFDMGGAETIGDLNRQTDSANQDLGALVRRFVDAVTPLEGRFSGAGKAAFDNFKNRSDLVASELNAALPGIVQGQGGMNTASSRVTWLPVITPGRARAQPTSTALVSRAVLKTHPVAPRKCSPSRSGAW